MNHRLLAAFIIAGCLAMTLQAQTALGIYGALRGSAGTVRLSGKNSVEMGTYGLLPAVGYRFTPYFRTELELAARTKKKHSDIRTTSEVDEFDDPDEYDEYVSMTYTIQSLMAQCYIDIPLDEGSIRPFINVGAGGTRGRVASLVSEYEYYDPDDADDFGRRSGKNSVSASWNIGAGLAYIYDDRLSIEAMYRYSCLGTFKLNDDGGKTKIRLHDLVIGARFNF